MKKKIKEFFQKERNILLFLLALCFAVRLVMFLKAGMQTGIAAKNILIAMEILKEPSIILGLIKTDILPLYHLLLSFLILIFKNPIIVAKSLSLIIGTITIIPFYLFTKTIFNKKIAFWSSLTFIVYLLHIKYSSLALANILLVFLILYGSYYFFRNLKNPNKRSLVFSFIFIGLACLLSYVAWVISVFYFILLLLNKRKKDALIFAIVPLIIILTVLSIKFFVPINTERDMLEKNVYFLNEDIKSIRDIHKEKEFLDQYMGIKGTMFYGGPNERIPRDVTSLFGVISKTFNPLIIVLGLIGIISFIIKKKGINYLLLISFITIFYLYKPGFNFIYNQAYFSVLVGILFIPLAIKGAYSITKKQFIIGKILLLVIVLVSLGYFVDYYNNLEGNSNIKEISEWVKNNTENSKFLISNKNNQMWTIVLYGDVDSKRYKEVDFLPEKIDGKYLYKSFSNRDISKEEKSVGDLLLSFMREEKPNYLIYTNDSNTIHTFVKFNISKDCKNEKVDNIGLKCIYEKEDYHIYKLTY